MASPRFVLPGRTYLVTRRCSERRFFLKPSPIVQQVYIYCLGVASERYGVSRAQVWKHVESLRALGYKIEATPGDGYQLVESPDRLYPEEILAGLETRWLGQDIRYLETTDSTNRVAQELARAGAAHGTAVVAEVQTAGRGRLGRSFFSPPHLNLYTSIVLRPELTTAVAPTWILASAVAVAEAIE